MVSELLVMQTLRLPFLHNSSAAEMRRRGVRGEGDAAAGAARPAVHGARGPPAPQRLPQPRQPHRKVS